MQLRRHQSNLTKAEMTNVLSNVIIGAVTVYADSRQEKIVC